ncbi:hypothetical protein PC122_g4839 [Phytophthora cactorum]|nr:hypothetical protein PC122_g4839 [Phytophthora cactorum]
MILSRWQRVLAFLFVAIIAAGEIFDSLRGVQAIVTNGRFQFSQAVYFTTEDFGVASITIQRGLGSDGRAAVYVSTIPGVGSAVAGRDFKPLYNVSLVWQDGEDFEKALYVPVYNDGKPQESPKTLLLKLHDAIGAEINPDRNQTQVVLVPPSNLVPGSFSFQNATVNNVAEDSTLTIPVLWVAGTTSTASVIFEIVCKSACFPADFVLVSPTTQLLGWKRDDYPATATTRMQSIVLKVLNDELYEQAESFSIRLVSVEPTQDSTIGIAQGPHLVSFDLDMALGMMTLRMNIPVQASTLDVTKLLLQSERVLKNGQTFKLTAQQTTTNSGDGTTIVLNIGAGDLNSLKRIVGLAKSANSVFLSTEAGLFQYVLDNCQSTGVLACSPDMTVETSRSAALAVTTFTADTLPPTLLGYSLDLPRRLLKLHFSEAVDFTTVKIEALTFAEAAVGIDVYRLSSATTRLFSPQPDPLSGATLSDANRLPADNTFLTLQLGRTDVTALSSFGAGRIGITRANTFLGMGSAFVADFAGNSVKAVGPPGKMLQISTADSYAPGTRSLSKLAGLRKIRFAIHVPSVVQVNMLQCPVLQRQIVCVHRVLNAHSTSMKSHRVQQTLCQRSHVWKRLQMRSPFSCPQPGQRFKTREEQLQSAKSNLCGSGRCSCAATGIPGNSNPTGEGFSGDSRCTGPVAYNILV